MKKWPTLLVLFAAWPLLTAGGGINPPPCLNPSSPTCGYAVKGPSLSVSVFMDPHYAQGDFGNPFFVDITPSAKQAVITVNGKGQNTTPITFKIVPSFPFGHGCDVTLTNPRFLFSFTSEANFTDWVPWFAIQQVAQQGGVEASMKNIPIFTSIKNARCIADPSAPAPVDGSLPGFLAFDATVQFLVFTGQ